ncbi:MAG TPA: CRISPR-associated helicase Cas3' [Pyrinomonadaceae bacterium]|jgi:CRISPR-associated endonuclease/helicase Cas3
MVVYAKSRPPETLAEHTKCLLVDLQEMRGLYGDAILQRVPTAFRSVFWDALELVAICHDLGKIHTPFQNKIRKKLNEPLLPLPDVKELPHNLLSPAFIKPLVGEFSKDVRRAIYQAITFHHFRGIELKCIKETGQWKQVHEVVEKDLIPVWRERLAGMDGMLPLHSLVDPKPSYKHYLTELIRTSDDSLYGFYVLLKGLLHRLDHAASAHLSAEEKPISEPVNHVTDYLFKQKLKPESIWQDKLAASCSNRNVILTASTGIGKTEFALYWLNGQKGFYTLPVRTSVNAMYDRLRKTFNTIDQVGLLHSDAYFYCLEDRADTPQADSNEEGALQSLHYVDVARQFAMPVTVSTADQLFTAVFKYKGYEKIYATLSYSKIIIDEIQAYDPEITAVILQGLIEIVQMGGQFCIVTATLPPIYREYLKTHVPDLEILPPKYLPAQKHKVKLQSCSIDSETALQQISDLYSQYKKVLIIVNTVKKAQILHQQLQDRFGNELPLSLLHSGFIYQDRRSRENEILSDDAKGVWITTQLAEVSLNIDFPVLLTEMATIDALIQRMGRVLRFVESHFAYNGPANIFVFQDASGIGAIYDRDIVQKTTEALEKIEGNTLNEEKKAELVESIFARSSLQGTKYHNQFLTSMKMLASNFEVDSKTEAQKLFRRISNLTVIPFEVYNSHMDEIQDSLKTLENKQTSRPDKFRALATIKNFTVSVPMFRVSMGGKGILTPIKGHDLFLLNMRYTPALGLEPSKQIENVF